MWNNKKKFKNAKMDENKAGFIELVRIKKEFEYEKVKIINAKHHKYLVVHIVKVRIALKKLFNKYNLMWIDYAWQNDFKRDLFSKICKVS